MNSVAEVESQTVVTHARIGLDDNDIATLLRVPVTLLTEVFAAELEQGRAERRVVLLSTIWQEAKDGKTSILVWLGKVELGWAQRAKFGNPKPHQKPDQSFNYNSFDAEFASLHKDGKPADEATLRRLAITAIQHELEPQTKRPPLIDQCIISTPSPGSSSSEPSSTTAGSPSSRPPSRPSS